MGHLRDSIFEIVQVTGFTVRELSVIEKEGIRRMLREKYERDLPTRALWERLNNAFSVRDPKAWEWIGTFVGDSNALLITTEYEHDDTAFEFKNGKELTEVLGETTNFEFYVTDACASYLFCFNHHDYLLAAGSAIPWLKKWVQEN